MKYAQQLYVACRISAHDCIVVQADNDDDGVTKELTIMKRKLQFNRKKKLHTNQRISYITISLMPF